MRRRIFVPVGGGRTGLAGALGETSPERKRRTTETTDGRAGRR